MNGKVTTLPPPATRETIKLLRDLAKRLERGEGVPIMVATALAGGVGTTIDARSHNIAPAGMLWTITHFLEAVRERANRTLGDPDAPEQHRAADAKAMLMASAAIFSLRDYAPTPPAMEKDNG